MSLHKFGHRVVTNETNCATTCLYCDDSSMLYSSKKRNEFVHRSEKTFPWTYMPFTPLTACLLLKLSSLLQGKFIPVLKRRNDKSRSIKKTERYIILFGWMWKHFRVRFDVSIQVRTTHNFLQLCFGQWCLRSKSMLDKCNVGGILLLQTGQGQPTVPRY